MKFKLDENLGTHPQELFRVAGHHVQTVRDEGLQGSSDQHLYNVCCAEQRCLVTLDLDFADTIRFPPVQATGIVVIRLPKNPSLPLMEELISQFLQILTKCPWKDTCGLSKLAAFGCISREKTGIQLFDTILRSKGKVPARVSFLGYGKAAGGQARVRTTLGYCSQGERRKSDRVGSQGGLRKRGLWWN